MGAPSRCPHFLPDISDWALGRISTWSKPKFPRAKLLNAYPVVYSSPSVTGSA
jgi:hypothetical protein